MNFFQNACLRHQSSSCAAFKPAGATNSFGPRLCKGSTPPATPSPSPGVSRRLALAVAAALTTAASSRHAVSAASPTAEPLVMPPIELDARGVERLALKPEGYNLWKWRSHNINYLSAGSSGPVVLLIHGFGASVYHYRYLVPQLAKTCRVFAVDCLGFGWSDKAVVDYEGYTVWKDQIADFIKEVALPASPGNDKVVVVGNSLGGYNSLATAAAHPELVRGVVLLNAAGRFDANAGEAAAAPAAEAASEIAQSPLQQIKTYVGGRIKRAVVGVSFIFTKQPARIKQVLSQVYYDPTNIDDDLVRSILLPAQDPNAAEVFYRIITASGTPVNRLLDQMKGMPLFLLWGSEDPWCVPARATQIQEYYPQAKRVDIRSGHCPHDDTPQVVGDELLRWLGELEA